MRVIYTDPGLRNNLGHHANSCRAITTELKRRGVPFVVLGFKDLTPELREELPAIPFFRAFTYWQTDGDPIAGWLNCFDSSARMTTEDLNRISGLLPSDIIYFNSAQPAQFMALVRWVKTMELASRPHIVLEFGTDPGLDVRPGDNGSLVLTPRDYRADPRAMFYRHTASLLSDDDLKRFHLSTFDAMSSTIYAGLLSRPVGVLPLPQFSGAAVRSRAGKRPITVGVLGQQRPDKGYNHMPEAARRLLAAAPEINLLVHNGAPADMAQTQAALRELAATEPRLELVEQTAGPELWRALMDRSDLILCPYDPARFFASYSAVATEALASGIPLVVPAGTSLSRLVTAYGSPGIMFESYTPAGIAAATCAALADFDALATRAVAAAAAWDAAMGVRHMVQAMLSKAR